MAEEKVLEGKETHIVHVGVIVKDLEKTVEFLTSLGFGPFNTAAYKHPNAIVRGKKTFWETKVALSKQGPVELELIEFQKGTSIQKEFLDKRGEGIHHLLFKVRNINATIEKFANKGIAVLQRDFPGGVGGPAYMDTAATGGICIEVMEDLPGFDADEN